MINHVLTPVAAALRTDLVKVTAAVEPNRMCVWRPDSEYAHRRPGTVTWYENGKKWYTDIDVRFDEFMKTYYGNAM